MYGLATRGNHPPLLQAALPSLQWPPPEPQQTGGVPIPAVRGGGMGRSVCKHRAFFWCLDLGAASLVPPLWKDPLFSLFTTAALKLPF